MEYLNKSECIKKHIDREIFINKFIEKFPKTELKDVIQMNKYYNNKNNSNNSNDSNNNLNKYNLLFSYMISQKN